MIKYKNIICLFVLSLFVIIFAGCFPSTVSVGPDGKVALSRSEGIFLLDLKNESSQILKKTADGIIASWVQWAPSGKRLLYVENYGISTCKPDGTDIKEIFNGYNSLGFVLWSPDEKYISVSGMSLIEKKEGETDLGLPDLVIIDPETGVSQTLTTNVSFRHAWAKDSKSIIVFHVLEKDEESGFYKGEIAQIDINNRKMTTIAKVCGEEAFLDISPDGNFLIFDSKAVFKKDGKITIPEKDAVSKLYRLNIKDGSFKVISENETFLALYSPKGDKIVQICEVTPPDKSLVVADNNGGNVKVIDSTVITETESVGGGTIVPAWLDNDNIIYWNYITILAPSGNSLTTFKAKSDGSKIENIQPLLERIINK